MAFPAALLRAGYPYLTTLGMRRVTTFPMDVAIGDEGRLYVLGRTEVGIGGNIRIINWDDEDLGTMADTGLTWPVCLIRDADENLYVSDEGAHTITVYNKAGEEQAKWGSHGSAPGELDRPSGIAFDAAGELWVADTLNHRIQHFSRDGSYLGGFGGPGSGEGEFNMPWGVSFDAEGDLYVVDWRNDRFQKFAPDGSFLMAVGRSGAGAGEFDRPAGIAIDEQGDIYVADRGNDRVQLFDKTGRYVETFIGDATLSKMGRAYVMANQKTLRLREMVALEPQKRLRAPASVRLDDEGRLYIADFGSHRVQVYAKEAYPLREDEIMAAPRSPTLTTT